MQPSNGQTYIVSAARTPIGKFGGALAAVPATELGGVAIRAAVERAGLDPAETPVDDVLMGQVLQAGAGQAPARQAALKAGLPDSTSATTINRVCGSGLKSIMLAAAEIRAGDAELVIAGGMESMNGAPYLLPGARFGLRLGNAELIDSTVQDGLWCSIEGCHMGTHAERVAIKDHVSREDQDAFDRREEQPLWCDLGLGVPDDPGERRQAEPFDGPLGSNDRGRGTVRDAGRVAGRDGALGGVAAVLTVR